MRIAIHLFVSPVFCGLLLVTQPPPIAISLPTAPSPSSASAAASSSLPLPLPPLAVASDLTTTAGGKAVLPAHVVTEEALNAHAQAAAQNYLLKHTAKTQALEREYQSAKQTSEQAAAKWRAEQAKFEAKRGAATPSSSSSSAASSAPNSTPTSASASASASSGSGQPSEGEMDLMNPSTMQPDTYIKEPKAFHGKLKGLPLYTSCCVVAATDSTDFSLCGCVLSSIFMCSVSAERSELVGESVRARHQRHSRRR
jgi:hypothetical protein